MPDEQRPTETDKDKTTAYEDTAKHERTGLKVDADESHQINQASGRDSYEV